MEKAAGPKEFPESMVTKALDNYLRREHQKDSRMKWLFEEIRVQTPEGTRNIHELCGFGWDPEQIDGGAELTLKNSEKDKGSLTSEEFKEFFSVTPDFQFWEKDLRRKGRVLIEAKGTPPIGQRDRFQAERYFRYMQGSGQTGAIVYFVPDPPVWLELLVRIAEQVSRARHPNFGVVNLKADVVPPIAQELIRVVAQEVKKVADLLDVALALP